MPTFEDDSSTAAAAFEAEAEQRGSKGRKGLPFTRRKDKRNGSHGREQRESEAFDNPVAEDDHQQSPQSPQSPESQAVAREVDRISSMNPEQQAAALAALDGAKREGRDRCSYVVMTVGICVLLPFFVGMALLSLWALWLAPNPMSSLVALVSTTVPVVMMVGRHGASTSSEPVLQAFSFLMTVAISMQLSVCVIFWLDDGILADAFIDSCETTAQEICQSDNLELWQTVLLMSERSFRDVCSCVDVGDGSTNGTNAFRYGGFASCLRQIADEQLRENPNAGGSSALLLALVVMLSTMAVEALLSYLAWGMIVDLDVRDAEKLAKQDGGSPIGAIRGELICGRNLRSKQDNLRAVSNGGKNRAQNITAGATHDLSCRHVVMSIATPDLSAKHEHRLQKVTTESVDDDPSPEFRHHFLGSEGFTIYESSRSMQIEVWDTIDPKQPVQVGTACVDMECDYETARMPEYEYLMDGEEGNYVNVLLTSLPEDKDAEPVAAGAVRLRLTYIPEPDLLGAATQSVLQSWYFEGTVVFMVILQMIVLAMQCPADPPSVVNFGAVKMLEIFIATHMTIELLMEWLVKANQGQHNIVLFYHDRWFALSLVVLVCNWLAIVAPSMTWVDVVQAETTTFIENTGIEARITDFTGMSFNDLPDIDVAAIDGSKTYVASILINTGSQGLDLAAKFKKAVSVMRVFRAVRPIRTLRMLKHVDIVLRVLGDSAGLFVAVSLLLCFLLGVFALVGMTAFGGALQFECIGDIATQEKPVCSAEQAYLASLSGLTDCPIPCPPTLACAEEHTWCAPLHSGKRNIGGDTYGYRDFDNFGKAIVTMFVQMTGDGGMHTVPLALADSGCTAGSAAWVISFVATLMLNLVALNLFLALCCSAYSESAAAVEELEAEKDRLRAAKRAELIAQGVIVEDDSELEDKPYEQLVAAKIWPTDSSRCPAFRNVMHDVVLNKWFERAISSLILANTVVMATYHEGMDQDTKSLLHLVEIGFLLVFTSEATMKLLGFGSTLYWTSTENRFDATIVATSIIGAIATVYIDQIQSLLGVKMDLQVVQALRAFRLLRALQLLRFMHRQRALMDVLKTVFRAWRPLAVHSLFCVFSISMFAVIGMHLLGGSLGRTATFEDYDTECSANLESMDRAMMTIFELTVGENWSFTMWWYMRYASLAYSYPEWMITALFVLMYVWMNCILFSLYVAMLLENFSVDETAKPELQKRMWGRQQRKAKRDEASEITRQLSRIKARGNAHKKIESTHDVLADAAKHIPDLDHVRNKSCRIFRLDSKVRLTAAKIQSSKAFSRTIMFLIAFSCLSLALGGPPGASTDFANQELHLALRVSNVLVLFAFILEATVKCIVHGIWRSSGPTQPYLNWRMNQVDALIIVVNLITYIPGVTVDATFARMVRMGRLVTPILSLSKNPEIKLVFVSFLRAAPDTAIMMVPLALLVLVFSIVGVATFGSVLAGCAAEEDPLLLLPDDTFPFGNETLCRQSDSGYIWTSPAFNFDSTGKAFATLFVAMTDGAGGITTATTVDNRFAQMYWVLFHLLFTTFFLNLFIGVLSASFEKTSGIALKTLREKQWAAVTNELAAFRPVSDVHSEMAPDSEAPCCKRWRTPKCWYDFRSFMFGLSTNNSLQNFWRLVIIVNVSTLAFESYPGSLQAAFLGIRLQLVIKAVNIFCLTLNAAEVVIKLVGFGLKGYFSDGWMVSDLLLVVSSVYLMLSGISSGVEVLRIIRIGRMIVLASKLPSLVSLIDTLIRCVRASLAMILITAIIVYLFTVLGMNLFGNLPSADVVARAGLEQDDEQLQRQAGTIIAATCPHCLDFTDSTNFYSFTGGAALLLQSSFGQGIGGFIRDVQYLGGSFLVALAFFGLFFVSIVWVCINLLLVTVLNNFEAATTEQHTGELAITPTDLDGYSYVWASLTVGPQGAHAVEDLEVDLLDYLATVRAEENREQGLAQEDPTTVNFEDGDPELCGTLTMHIEELSGFSTSLDLRPYCTVQVDGPSATCKHSMFTSTAAAELGKGVASWQKTKKNGTKGKGAKLQCHITSFQEELNFCVRDSYAFCDGWIGGARVSLEQIRSQPQQTITLNLRANADDFVEARGTRADQWQRFERFKQTTKTKVIIAQRVLKGFGADALTVRSDGEQLDKNFDDTPASPDGGTAESQGTASADDTPASPNGDTAEGQGTASDATDHGEAAQVADDEDEDGDDAVDSKRVQKLKRIADKKEAKRRKRAKKEAAKAEKRRAKEAKKAEKLAKKLAKKQSMDAGGDPTRHAEFGSVAGDAADAEHEQPNEEDEKPPHKFDRPGWEENGLQLKVTYDFQPSLSLVRSTTFMRDFRTKYVNKESSCGIEGWLEVADRPNGRFSRRFCYLQQYPRPCLKICTRGSDIFELEKAASTDSLKLTEVVGTHIRSISAGQDGNTFIVRGKATAGNSEMEEQQIGHFAGTVLRATNVRVSSNRKNSPLYCVVGLVSQCDDEKQGRLLCRYEGKSVSRAIASQEFEEMDVRVSRSGILTVASDSREDSLGVVEVDLTAAKTKIVNPNMAKSLDGRMAKSLDAGQSGDQESLALQVQAGSPSQIFSFQFHSEAEKTRWRSVFALAAGLSSELKTQSFPTMPVEPDIGANKGISTAAASAEWNQDLELNVFSSTRAMTLRVFEGQPRSIGRKAVELGAAEINIAHAAHAGDLGPTLSGDCLGQNRTVSLSRMPTTVRVFLRRPAAANGSSTASGDASRNTTDSEAAGEVEIKLDYIEMIPNSELSEKRQANGGSLCDTMMIPATNSREYHFRATRRVVARQWTAALRWVATGCSMQAYAQNFAAEGLPDERLSKRELRRLERNIALVDLPFSRIGPMLKYLYNLRVMGSHKPTTRRTMYTIFNLETFAWTADVATREHKASVKANGRSSAVYLNELRGISFYKCLERLALLHYGKARCLNYEAQMLEYNTELKQASLLVVSAWVSWWVFKRAKTVQGHPWPWEEAWKKCPNAYALAIDKALEMRLRSLRTLLQEIDKRKPELADLELQTRETATRAAYKTRKYAKVVKRNRKELRRLFKILDLDGDGTLDEEEFRHAMGRLSAADGAELDSILGTLVFSDEDITEDMFVEALADCADAARNDPKHWIWKLQIPDDTADGQAVSALTRGSDKLFHDKKKVLQLSELRNVFSSIDADGDGTLDEDEIRRAMGRLSTVEASQFEAQLAGLTKEGAAITEETFVEALSAAAGAARNDPNHWVWRLALDEDDLDEELDEFEDDLDDLDAEYLPQIAE